MTRSLFLMPLLFVAVTVSGAEAKKLPKNAKPMSAEEVAAIYSGNSAVWENSKVYFSPEKKVVGVFGKGKKRTIFSGEWTVTDNEACMKNKAKGDPKTYTDCWKWWHVDKVTLTLWSVHFDNSKPDTKNGYYDETKNIKQGDMVTNEYQELGGT